MSDDTEELLKEIASKHGIAVGRDDPILILQTMNKRLMVDSARAQRAMLDEYKNELKELTEQFGQDIKTKSERIINVSLSAGRESIAQAAQESARKQADVIRAEIGAALSRVEASLASARTTSLINIAAACIALAASCGVLIVVFYR